MMDNNGLSIAVIGGGIGGLTAALCLHKLGIDVHVYEQALVLREVGAGINVQPNATRVIHTLGLGEELAKLGVMPTAIHQRRWDDGRILLRTPLGTEIERHFGFREYQSHRADLLNMLIRAIPPERVHLGHRLVSFRERSDKVEVQFENGACLSVDALIGADGVHSTVQRLLFGATPPRFTGCAAYRGLVPAERVRHLDLEVVMQITIGPGSHFVNYFVAGERLVNFVGVIEQPNWTKESWTDRGDLAQARVAFAGWHKQVRGLLDAVEETFIWGLFDRAPLPRWSMGRVTLLGDACHPMLPFMAQGAAQAMEDGMTLMACLNKIADIPQALARYQELRLPRTSFVQSLAATNKTRFHLRDGPEQAARDAKMAAGGTDWSVKAIGWLWDYDPAAVVETGSLGLPPAA
jgi:2-polyprenyl-6-methoxyphenol hydroxylase-like FAD-dependent oxidoreductase